MDLNVFKFFLFALIVLQCCHSADAATNSSKSLPLKDIIKEQQVKSDLEKQQKLQQEPASYADKLMTSTSKGSESEATPSKEKKEATKLNINEATRTTAVEDSYKVKGTKKELNKGKEKVEDQTDKNIEDALDGKTGVSVQQKPDGNYQYDLIQPLDMQLNTRFNELFMTEESLPEVQIKITNLEDTIGTDNVGQIMKNKGKGKGKGKKKKQQQQSKMVEESHGNVVGSGSAVKQNENENDTIECNSFPDKGIFLTEMQLRQFRAEFEPFITRQEAIFEKELKKINDGEILHKSYEQLLFGMSEERHGSEWHKALRKVLVRIMEGTLKFWGTNVAQIVPKEPSSILIAYKKMTAIYMGPKEGRGAEAKKMFLRVNEVAMLVFKGFWMHNTKSIQLFMNAMKEFSKKIVKFQSEFDRIRNTNLNDKKKKEKSTEALGPVTSFYKLNFVEVEKCKEYFHVALLMENEMPKVGLELSKWMKLRDENSAEMISKCMDILFHKTPYENFKAEAIDTFNDYFKKVQAFPSIVDVQEMKLARTQLVTIGKRMVKNTNT